MRFLVDRFGEEFKYEDPRISGDYIDKSNMYGQYEIFLDDDDENPPVIAIWENEMEKKSFDEGFMGNIGTDGKHLYSIIYKSDGWDGSVQEYGKTKEDAIQNAIAKGKLDGDEDIVKIVDLGEQHPEYMSESEEDARSALARELGIGKSKVRLSEDDDDYDYYNPDYTFKVQTKDGSNAVYLVYDNEESAIEAATDDVLERFEDDPPILASAIDYFGFSFFKEFVNGLDEDELDDLESLKDDLHTEEFAKYVQRNIGVDYRGLAKYSIEQFGPAWHIATYDGRELELSNGMLAYRVE